jgi:hypothetical protein
MRKILLLLFLTNIILIANPTYVSLTKGADASGNKGFKKQIENIPLNNENGSDITLGVAYTFPFNAGKISEDDSRYNDITWCTNGMLRVKVYVPPHIDSLQVVMQILPLNSGVGFATYVPMGEINEYESQDKTEVGKTAFYNNLWNEHKTVTFNIDNVFSFVLNDYAKSKYDIDDSEGGYLYLSFSQVSKINQSAKAYDARYQMAFSLYYDFKHPFTDAMRNDVLSVIPNGLTEPVEESQTLVTRECTGSRNIALVTEEGVAKSLEEICRDNNGVFVDSECYYLPTDQEKYNCVVVDHDSWNGSRCVREEETLCNQNPQKKWYIAGDECLEIEDEISTASSFDSTQETTLLYDKNDTSYKVAFYHANEENWETEIKLSNNNITSTTTQKITILNSDMSKILLSFNVSIESQKEWSAYIYEKDHKLYIDSPLPGSNDSNVTQMLSEYITKGVVLVEPEETVNMNTDILNVGLKYGLNLLQPTVALTQAQQECRDNGGSWTNALGCIGATAVSSTQSSSSSSESLTDAQQECKDNGGSWTNALGCIGGGVTTDTASSSSSVVQEDSEVVFEKITSIIASETYEVSGWLARYDFINVDNELDWVFISKSRKVYQLQGDSSNGVFGWKRVYVVPTSKAYAMIQIGDWDVDGDGKFDWLAVDKSSNRVYKISGVNDSGRFIFLDYRPINVEFEFSENEEFITFTK